MGEWQPIKTMPKDHKELVIYAKRKGDRWMVGLDYWTVSGKYFFGPFSKDNAKGYTHWQPLPAPPKEQS